MGIFRVGIVGAIVLRAGGLRGCCPVVLSLLGRDQKERGKGNRKGLCEIIGVLVLRAEVCVGAVAVKIKP